MKYDSGASVFALTILALFFGIGAWEVFADKDVEFFFSKPSKVVAALTEAARNGQAWTDGVATFSATISGALIGALAGISVGVLGISVPRAKATVTAIVSALAAFPILAIAPVFMLWFGTGIALKVSLAAMLAGFVFAGATLRTLSLAGKDLLDIALANRWKKSSMLMRVYWPLGAREILWRLPDATNAAFLGAFVGEFVAADRGVGYRILRSGSLYQVDQVFAYALLAVLILLLLQGLAWIGRGPFLTWLERLSITQRVRS